MSIQVNGIEIHPAQIYEEMQYHRASSQEDAQRQATKALIVKELLIQQACRLGLAQRSDALKKTDEVIDLLLDQEIPKQVPDLPTCEAFYHQNQKLFYTSPLFEVSHILYLAPPDDDVAKSAALEKATRACHILQNDPQQFESIAKNESACSSKEQGGRLGQLSKGQTVAQFEQALWQMQAGETSISPVLTEIGYHIIRVHQRVEGQLLPFSSVQPWIIKHLSTQIQTQQLQHYLEDLARQTTIEGFAWQTSATGTEFSKEAVELTQNPSTHMDRKLP